MHRLGDFSWTPTEGQGPGLFTVIVRATDQTGAFDTEVINIEVCEVNLAPSLAVLPDIDLRPGDSWQASASGSDPTCPFRIPPTAAPAMTRMSTIDGSHTDRQASHPRIIDPTTTALASRHPLAFNNRVITSESPRASRRSRPLPNVTIPEMVERTIAITAGGSR